MNEEKSTILYIDDEESNLRSFYALFRRKYKILTAKNGKEGLEILETTSPDLILTDQRMPGMSGIDFLREAYERNPGRPPSRIMVSGYAKPEEVEDARKNDLLQDFIAKPWKMEDLEKVINEAIENVK